MPKLINLHDTLGVVPEGAIRIDRLTKWGNPFRVPQNGPDAESVIRQYEEWLDRNHRLLKQIHELQGKDLACWCHPDPCHGTPLMKRANP